MNFSIHEMWVVYYTLSSFSPSLAIDVMFSTREEAENAVIECQKEDYELKFISPSTDITYYVVTVAEWVRKNGEYEFRQGEQYARN